MKPFRLEAGLTVDIEPGTGHVGFVLAGRCDRPAYYDTPSSEVVYTLPKPLACDLLAMPLPLSEASTSRSMLEQVGGMLFISSKDGGSLLHSDSVHIEDESSQYLTDLFFTVCANGDFDPSTLEIEIDVLSPLDRYLHTIVTMTHNELLHRNGQEVQEVLANHGDMHPIQNVSDYIGALTRYLKSGFLRAQERFNDDPDYAHRTYKRTDKVLFEALMRDDLALGSEFTLTIDGESVILTEGRDSRPPELIFDRGAELSSPYTIHKPARGKWLPDGEPSGPEF